MIRVILNTFKSEFQFGLGYLLEIFMEIVWIFLLAYIWTYFGYKDGLKYFVISNLIAYSTFGFRVLGMLDDKIREGNINYELTYPISFARYYISELFGERFSFDFIIGIILFVWTLILIGIKAILLLIPLIFSLIFSLLFYFPLTYLSFRTEGAKPICRIFNGITKWMLSGVVIPTEFLRKMIPFYDYLPFKYLGGIGYEFLRNPSSLIPGIVWLPPLLILSIIAYQKSFKYYQAYGG